MKVTIVTYSSLQDFISICANGQEVGMPYDKVKEALPDIFSVEDIFSINYEVERDIFNVVRSDQVAYVGRDVPEIVWIEENFDRLFETCRTYSINLNKDTIRQLRINQLYDTDWVVLRHQEQVSQNIETSITEEKYQEVLEYRQYLRDLGSTGVNLSDPWDTITWRKNPIYE